MIKPQPNVIRAKAKESISKGTVVIDSGSFVYDNKWISYQGTVFDVFRYIDSVVDGVSRTRFFNNRNYALQLLVGIDQVGSLNVVEGEQIEYSTKSSVPIPSTFNMIPIVSILMVQDGSSDVVYGFKPLDDSKITFFSGAGNVIDKNKIGKSSDDSGITGLVGGIGYTGIEGSVGSTGMQGFLGLTGPEGWATTGSDGVRGMTGINWDIHIPFEVFF